MQRVLVYNNVWNFDLFDYLTVYENEKLLAYTYTKSYSTQQIIDRTGKVFYAVKNDTAYNQMIPPSYEDQTIYTVLKIQSDFDSEDAMYIIGGTSVAGLNERLCSMASFEGAKAFLINNKGIVYASTNPEDLGNFLNDQLFYAKGQRAQVRFAGEKYDLIRKRVNNDFQILYMFPKQAIMRQTLIGMESLIIVSVIIAVLMVFILTLVESSYEARHLNDEAEIKFLQHQMNPHFLFNILLTIQIKAKMSKDESVYKMISSLSSLLRAGIYKDERGLISIEEELKYVEYYLSLQKERYEDKLTYNIIVDDEALKKCEIPRLSIEPIVENAVIHGVEACDRPALVTINVTAEGGDLIIHVTDNGVGFDVDEMDLESESDRVGLRSTQKRIQLIYGKEYGLDVVSYKDIGTDIAIRVPQKKWV
ncbi:Putative regulator of cell autolysis [Butyrivibrio fibrisolvens 16/4]|nr:Putative regulator of cell autolysis [Butyrivibrio fibrisolvens 16/4]